MPKATKADPDKVAAEVKNMQQELKALEKALGELLDAMNPGEETKPLGKRKAKKPPAHKRP